MCYSEFFKMVTGFEPFPYQVIFGESSPTSSQLLIPTGGAKTLTILVRWLWRHAEGLPVSTRLVVVEPMRVLVSQVVGECQKAVTASNLDIPVHRLMGGDIDNSWVDYPARPAIIVGTQDQILSRSLMRGYGCSRWSWPKHFALLHNDCEYFIDECQLMGPGYSTSAWLAALRDKQEVFGECPVTWASATLDPTPLERAGLNLETYTLTECDLKHLVLGERINRLKQLHQAKTVLGKDLDTFAQSLACEVLANHEPDSLTLVILSQVDRALEAYRALQDKSIPTRLLHSRFRRCDREQLTEGLLDFCGILISTQVVEAGVDLDARRLFTDLCSWASFVQRAGRCGRRGKYPNNADIYWIDTETPSFGKCLPYSTREIEFTSTTLLSLPDASINTLMQIEAPKQKISGSKLTEHELKKLFDTHPSPDGMDDDVAKYIREKSDRNIQIAWFSEGQPQQDWMPTDDELCSVPLNKLKEFIDTGWVWNAFEEQWRQTKTDRLKPGLTVAIAQDVGGYSAQIGWTGSPADVPSIPTQTGKREAYKSDESSSRYTFVSLTQHSQDTFEEMEALIKAIPFELPEELPEIARWHDLGKAHEIFQKAMGTPDPMGAKGKFRARYDRAGFRHEFASALAALHHGKEFYFAYLVAAHHGKVRVSIAPMPWDDYESGLWRGIKTSESLPAVNLGNGEIEESKLNISDRDAVGWWKGEVRDLIDAIGVFRLSYLEALIRAADVAASARW